MTETPHPVPARSRLASPGLVGVAAGVVYFLIALGVILSGRIPARAAYDDLMYHEPAIREFARQWPRFYFFDYLSATTPGYHLLQAGVARYVSSSREVLQCTSALIGCGFVGLVVGLLTREVGARWGVLLALPLAASSYIFQSTAYLLPDNSSWLLILLGIVLCLRPWSVRNAVALGLVVGVGVMVRQPLIWLLLPALAGAWVSVEGPSPGTDQLRTRLRSILGGNASTRMTRLATVVVTMLPALAILGYFARLWHGLTPPRFQHQHEGFGLSTPVFVLANIGMASAFYAPLLWPAVRRLMETAPRSVVLVVVGSAAIGVIEPSTRDESAGRFSGLWNLGDRLPHVEHVSLLIFVLAVFGGLALLCWLAVFGLRQRIIVVLCVAAFTAAQSANHLTLQRYVEPFVLLLIPFGAARVLQAFPMPRRPMLVAGVLGLTAFMGAVSAQAFFTTFTPETYPRSDATIEGGPFVPPELPPGP